MRFTILATVVATAASVVIAAPVHADQSTTTVIPIGESSQSFALALMNGSEKKHSNLLHNHEHEEEEEASRHSIEEHHPDLSRRAITMAEAQGHAKEYKKLQKTHENAAITHLNSADRALNAGEHARQQAHLTQALIHQNEADRYNHLAQAYGSEVKAQRSDRKAANADPGSAAQQRHLNDAYNARAATAQRLVDAGHGPVI
ncbi:hypothetical protein FRC18_001505 [Serendipita sp. 400]|nr:hypothetical protein FRC18_001505 [Serendipita sp. 400]